MSTYYKDPVTGEVIFRIASPRVTFEKSDGTIQALDLSGGGTLRNIATRCRTCNQNSASYTQMNSRTLHINRGSSLNKLQIVFPNWFASVTSENNFVTAATITAAIEYPEGVFHQVTFSGSASGSIPAGSNLVSDEVWVGIPKHATFWVRSYFVNASGVYTSPNNVMATTGNAGEYCMAVASGGVDYTMTAGATNSPPFTGAAYYPVAIIGISNVPSVCCVGDSRTSGQGDDSTTDGSMYNIGEIGRSIGRYLPYTLVATPGDKLLDFNTRLTKRSALATYHTHVHIGYGINDLGNGASAKAVQNGLAFLYTKFPGKKITQSTLSPQTASSDGWTTQVGQTQVTSSQARLLVNTWIRSQPAPLVAVFDIAKALQYSADQLRWKFPGYTADGTHATPLGYKEIISSGFVDVSKIL